jgi:hypothetical protein
MVPVFSGAQLIILYNEKIFHRVIVNVFTIINSTNNI